jgi:hypothetical protein
VSLVSLNTTILIHDFDCWLDVPDSTRQSAGSGRSTQIRPIAGLSKLPCSAPETASPMFSLLPTTSEPPVISGDAAGRQVKRLTTLRRSVSEHDRPCGCGDHVPHTFWYNPHTRENAPPPRFSWAGLVDKLGFEERERRDGFDQSN